MAYRFARRRLGKVPEPVTITAHHPWIFHGMSGYELALERARRVEAKLKALAEIKAATSSSSAGHAWRSCRRVRGPFPRGARPGCVS